MAGRWCLGSGMAWQVLSQEHGLLAFIGSATPGTAMLPFASWLLYLGAIVSGAWYVVPKALSALRTVWPDMHVLMLVAVAGAMALGEWCEAAERAWLCRHRDRTSFQGVLGVWQRDRDVASRTARRSAIPVPPSRCGTAVRLRRSFR